MDGGTARDQVRARYPYDSRLHAFSIIQRSASRGRCRHENIYRWKRALSNYPRKFFVSVYDGSCLLPILFKSKKERVRDVLVGEPKNVHSCSILSLRCSTRYHTRPRAYRPTCFRQRRPLGVQITTRHNCHNSKGRGYGRKGGGTLD